MIYTLNNYLKRGRLIINGELLQLAQVVTTAKHYIKTNQIVDCIDYKFINEVQFVYKKKSLFGEKLIYNNFHDWLRKLPRNSIDEIYLLLGTNTDKIKLAGFSNAISDWCIILQSNRETIFLTRQWNYNASIQKWNITYTEQRTQKNNTPLESKNNISELKKSLFEIEGLAKELEYDGWANWFRNAYSILDGKDVDSHFNTNMLNILSKENQKILDALTWAWVFGGMGSWNDSPPYTAHEKGLSEQFDEITNNLYINIMHALMYCIND